MIQDIYKITDNYKTAPDTYVMSLAGNTSGFSVPGQFVNIAVPGFSLRRPFSAMGWDTNEFRIMYKVTGHGTEFMTAMKAGDTLDVLTGLGNGFDISLAGPAPLLIAGGSGISPIYCLAEKMTDLGIMPTVLMGFASVSNVVLDDKLRDLGCRVLVTTEDGTCGKKGVVTDALEHIDDYSFVYCCGPVPMMKAVGSIIRTDGQFSFEARMGCGFGACMGCSMKTVNGTKRVCKDGPVFGLEEIIW